MSQQQSDHLDFSGLFKLDVLIHLDISTYSFYEVGLKKFFAFSSDKELVFLFIDAQSERFEKNYDWDFLDNPIYCMCFEPSGTWLIIVSEQKVLLVPYLPLFIPRNDFDHKWSLSGVTVLPLALIPQPTSMVCWLTKESEKILIIGIKTGTLYFYSLELQSVVAECKVAGEITDLQICFDDSLDLLALLISGGKSQQWKLVLEHRSVGYNWLQARAQTEKDKKDGFMSYIKQLSKDKITLLIQGGSKDDNKSETLEYIVKPTEYLPTSRKGSNNWALSAQYVNGRHFLTAFELNEGTLILESPEKETPSKTLKPFIKKDKLYIQGLWSQRLIYLVRKNELEIHSADFSEFWEDRLLGTIRKDEFSELWSAEVIGDVKRAHLMTAKESSSTATGWQEPTFMCDLQLPRFALESCLIVTTCGAYIMNTVSEPCEWLVGLIMRGEIGAERSAAALAAPINTLLKAAADMLLSRGKCAAAHYLFSLSQSQQDGWLARLGVFGKLRPLSLYEHAGDVASLGNSAITIKLLALLLKMATNEDQKFNAGVNFTTLSSIELSELASFAAAFGFWELVPVFSIHRGHLNLMLAAIKSRRDVCRGAINCLLQQRCVVPLLLDENAQWLFDYIAEKCDEFDIKVLKCLSLWLNPLQDQLRSVMRDLKQGITTVYSTRMLNLISTFVQIASAIEARAPCPEIYKEIVQDPETWKNQFTPQRRLSCGLAHWAVADDGKAKIMMTNTQVNTEVIGRVIDIACGRHHTLVLTESGIYSAGDNTYGQLGVGAAWRGAVGEATGSGGALRFAPLDAHAPLVSLAAGYYHSAVIDAGGRLYTWGWGVHGQLGLGSIDDKWTPQLVTKFQGRKVISVGCGACHTVALMANGEVWAMGASAFGQLGRESREKSSVPVRVSITEHVESIAVGYFHNLCLTNKGQVWVWGATLQQLRAGKAPARVAAPPAPAAPDAYLAPKRVFTAFVDGHIQQIAAGWHHSCILTNTGTLYTWGLNFDGQLGLGDLKQVNIPSEAVICTETQCEPGKSQYCVKTPDDETTDMKTKAMVACGGDFTIYVDDDGRIFASGISYHLSNQYKNKENINFIMMKTTRREISIPSNHNYDKFQVTNRLDVMFPFDIHDMQRKPLEPRLNPLMSMKDFKKKSWADDIIMILKPWINEEVLIKNPNMAAKLAYHNGMYSDCLKFLLDNLKSKPHLDKLYVTHSLSTADSSDANNGAKHNVILLDEKKIAIKNIMAKRIKEISLSILNEAPYPIIDNSTYQLLPCCCDELKYIKKSTIKPTLIENRDISIEAAEVIDKCMTMFPINNELWETCFRLSKNFYLENNLPISHLETILFKYMESNAKTMAAAIMYSSDCAQYCEILSPRLYLNMCSQVMDTWG